MSRLLEADVEAIEIQLQNYEAVFAKQTGYTMAEIAKKAVNITGSVSKRKTAVVPITSGLGIIDGFTDAVAAILRHCQVDTFISGKTDVAGLQEAYLSKCQVAFLADDDVCAAFGIDGAQSDNGWATGTGFAAALVAAMIKQGINPSGARVLIIGAGPVGRAAARYIAQQQAVPIICDLDNRKAADAAAKIENASFVEAPAALNQYTYIIDASTSKDLITADDVTEKTIIAAPGMPCGVTAAAGEKATVIHNPLELGIITMYFDCIKQLEV